MNFLLGAARGFSGERNRVIGTALRFSKVKQIKRKLWSTQYWGTQHRDSGGARLLLLNFAAESSIIGGFSYLLVENTMYHRQNFLVWDLSTTYTPWLP
jgi:hypothetical protein